MNKKVKMLNRFNAPVRLNYMRKINNDASILLNKDEYKLIKLGDRSRYSTSESVRFYDERNFFAVDFFANSIRQFTYSEDFSDITLVDKVDSFMRPADITFTADNKTAAVLQGNGNTKISLHAVNQKLEAPYLKVDTNEINSTHAIRFSPDNEYLLYSEVDLPCVYSYKVTRQENNSLSPELVSTYDFKEKTRKYGKIRAKSFDFTKDGKYIVICYTFCSVIWATPLSKRKSLIMVHKYADGVINPEPDYVTSMGLCVPEHVKFFNDENLIIAANHGDNSLAIFKFNKDTAEVKLVSIFKHASLNFPHGIDVSPDGRYLLVTNMKDDSIIIFKIHYTPRRKHKLK